MIFSISKILYPLLLIKPKRIGNLSNPELEAGYRAIEQEQEALQIS
jgi:hypothetical protein